MHLSHLSLTNFRNFARLESDFAPGATLLVGANAQGKTSLLEAVYYVASATSPHAASDRQLINFLTLREPTPYARLIAEVRRGGRLQRIEVRLVLETASPGETRLHREVLINGVKRRTGDLAEGLNAVLFLPQDMIVVEGPPAERRRHLDATLSQAEPTYANALLEYAKVVTQRNALLKQLQERGQGGEQLAFWDEQLGELGATLIRSRATALAELERVAAPIHASLTRRHEALRLEYLPAFDPLPHPDGQLGLPLHAAVDRAGIGRKTIQEGLLAALRATRTEDIARGATSLGPHRDDFRFTANGVDLRPYGSRGQNRTAMLALKLAEVEWLKQRTGEWPVLLLDEVLAELDAERREDLLTRVLEVPQALLTAADLEMFTAPFRRRAAIWQIVAGTLRPTPAEARQA
jgi:DNA replication and repair protein RecF